MKTKILAATVLVLTGCITPYAQFYQGERELRSKPMFVEPQEPIQVYGSDDLDRDIRIAARKNLVVMGSSAFNSGGNMTDTEYARSFARELGAQAVLIKSKYSHTVSGSIPITTPTSSTSYTTGSATAYGAGGSATAYGSATTTTYGSQTTYVPYSVARSDYTAVFLARGPPPRLGIVSRELPEATRHRLGTNAGILVWEVVEGSTAYSADVVPDDVLLSIGGDRVESRQQYGTLLDKYEGTSQVLVLDRSGQRIEKTVEIRRKTITNPNPKPAPKPNQGPARR